MSIYRHTPQQIAEYFASNRMNQSSLKVIISEGIESFIVKRDELIFGKENVLYYEEKEHEIIGNAVDCYLTQGEEEYYRQYAVSKMPRKPPEKPMSIIRALFDRLVINKENYYIEEASGFLSTTPSPKIPAEARPLSFFKKDIYDIMNQHQYYMNFKIPKEGLVKAKGSKEYTPDTRTWKDDNRINTMLGDGLCEQYWEELKGSIGKQILADNESSTISAIIMSLKTHKFTSYLFEEENGFDTIFQMPLYFELEGLPCKILPDIIIVNHIDNRIGPLDGKTTSKYITRFNKEIKRYRYDLQAAFYTKGIDLCRDQVAKLLGLQNSSLDDYEIDPFCFVVESVPKPGTPLIYALDWRVIMEGESGDVEKGLEGFQQGLYKYREWKAVDFSLDRKYADTNGVVMLEKNYEKENI